MKFVDPTNELAFKKIFGDIKKKHILMSFLNAMLDFKKEMDQQNELETAENRGFQRGKLEVARNLLDVLEDEIIAQTTGLFVDDIKKLRNQ